MKKGKLTLILMIASTLIVISGCKTPKAGESEIRFVNNNKLEVTAYGGTQAEGYVRGLTSACSAAKVVAQAAVMKKLANSKSSKVQSTLTVEKDESGRSTTENLEGLIKGLQKISQDYDRDKKICEWVGSLEEDGLQQMAESEK